MSDTTYLGRNMRRFESSPQFDGYSKVVVTVSDEVEYTAGNDTGRTMRLTCPWGTKEMAQNILRSIRGFQYQPYSAEGAILDPAVELGDGVSANNVYGGVYTRKMKFGPRLTATVAAPEDEEIDHEYPYQSKLNKEIVRESKRRRAELKIQDERISLEIQNRKKDVETLTAQLAVQAGLIEAKVSKTGGDASTFGWELKSTSWEIKADNTTVLKATKDGLVVKGKITATSGKVGGFTIESNYLSSNSQTWGGTNKNGIYIGPKGIQMGTVFSVSNTGKLNAASGEFSGTVHAGQIKYGVKDKVDYGSFSGSGISAGSISGSRMVANTITTDYTSKGINAALNDATWAANLFSGVRDYDASIRIGMVSCETLYQGGYSFTKKSVTIKDYYGDNITISYWG